MNADVARLYYVRELTQQQIASNRTFIQAMQNPTIPATLFALMQAILNSTLRGIIPRRTIAFLTTR